jgi:hypothetical protein
MHRDWAPAVPRRCRRSARNSPTWAAWNQARWVAQAIYFASRIEHGIDRGHGTPNANQEGLATAYEGRTAGSGYRA